MHSIDVLIAILPCIKRVECGPSPSIFVANTDTLMSVEGEQEDLEEKTSNVCVQMSPSQESIMAKLHSFSLKESE